MADDRSPLQLITSLEDNIKSVNSNLEILDNNSKIRADKITNRINSLATKISEIENNKLEIDNSEILEKLDKIRIELRQKRMISLTEISAQLWLKIIILNIIALLIVYIIRCYVF